MILQVAWNTALQPVRLEFGGGQQLADIVVELPAQALPLAFLNLEQAIGKFCRAQGNRTCPVAQMPANAQHRDDVQDQHTGRHRQRVEVQRQVGDDRGQAQQRGQPAQ
ncbi:hypothetical protein D9M73_147880 [compost metagenome]